MKKNARVAEIRKGVVEITDDLGAMGLVYMTGNVRLSISPAIPGACPMADAFLNEGMKWVVTCGPGSYFVYKERKDALKIYNQCLEAMDSDAVFDLAGALVTQKEASEMVGVTDVTMWRMVERCGLRVEWRGRNKLLKRKEVSILAKLKRLAPGAAVTRERFLLEQQKGMIWKKQG